jgi:SAM-dependent methyltransferase
MGSDLRPMNTADAFAQPTGTASYSSAIADARNYMDWVLAAFRPFLRGRIVEVGIGHGSYCTLLQQYGDYLGVDIDPASVAVAQTNFPTARFVCCDILDRGALQQFSPEPVDAILTVNVLEHIEDDLSAVSNLIELLRPGGHLLISVPAMDVLYNDLDRLAGHHRRYSVARLRRLVEPLDVQIVRLCYFNPIGALGWWLNSLKTHRSLDSDVVNNQIRFFDAYLVPISRALDPLFRGFFGQSVTCVLRRT